MERGEFSIIEGITASLLPSLPSMVRLPALFKYWNHHEESKQDECCDAREPLRPQCEMGERKSEMRRKQTYLEPRLGPGLVCLNLPVEIPLDGSVPYVILYSGVDVARQREKLVLLVWKFAEKGH